MKGFIENIFSVSFSCVYLEHLEDNKRGKKRKKRKNAFYSHSDQLVDYCYVTLEFKNILIVQLN